MGRAHVRHGTPLRRRCHAPHLCPFVSRCADRVGLGRGANVGDTIKRFRVPGRQWEAS
jgi:hypothetical protein